MALWGISWVQLEDEMTERQILLMAQRATERLERQTEKVRPVESNGKKQIKRSMTESVLMMMGRN